MDHDISMKKNSIKVLAFLLAAVICLSLLPTSAFAAEGDYTFTITHTNIESIASLLEEAGGSETGYMSVPSIYTGGTKPDGNSDNPIKYTYQLCHYTDKISLIRQLDCIKINGKSFDIPEYKTKTIISASDISGLLSGEIRIQHTLTERLGFTFSNVTTSGDISVEFVWKPLVNPNTASYKATFGIADGQSDWGKIWTPDTSFVEDTEDSSGSIYTVAVSPNPGYIFDHWEMTTAAEPKDSDWSIASELNDVVKTSFFTFDPYVKSTATVTVTTDTQFRAYFRPSQMLLQGGYIRGVSTLPEQTLSEETDTFIRAWAPGTVPSKKSVSVGSPAQLYINWWADAPIANHTNVTISLYEGNEAEGTPLYTVTKPLQEAGPSKVICGNPAEKELGYVFNLYFTMPDIEAMTVSIQLEGRDPIVQTYSTGITKEIAGLREKYDTLDNLKYRYLISKALDTAAVEVANTTDAAEIAAIISKAESQIQSYVNGTDTSYIEVSFGNTLVYVPANLQQTYAFCAALEQVYPREKGFWYLDYAATQFGIWLNGYGGRLYTESELGPDGIAHTDDDGPLETDITTYSKTWAAGESLPQSGMVQGKQAGGLQYSVNGFYADFGMSGWLVSEDEQFTWGPDDTSGYDPLYTLPHVTGTSDEEKQLKWTTMVLHREGVTLEEITQKLGDTSGKSAAELYPLLREAYKDKPYADRLVWNLPTNFTENAYVQDAYTKCSALTGNSDTADVEAAQAAYDAIPNTDFGSKIWRTHYFVNYEPYKTAYENLRSHDSLPVPSTDPALALTGVLSYLKANVTNPTIGSVNGEWAVLAMARGGILTDDAKNAYLTNLDTALQEGTSISKYTDYQRVTLALSSLGIDASKYGSSSRDLTAIYQTYLSADQRGAENQTLMADIFALIALNSKPYSGDQSSYVDALCNAALASGGWSLVDSAAEADVDTTAMAIQALAPYYSTSTTVKTKVDAALTWLKSKQDTTTGAFTSYSGSVSTCSTAQVVTALCALGQDPTGTQWTVGSTNPVKGLTLYYIGDTGAFGESSTSAADQLATEQAAYALVAYHRLQEGSKSLYDMRDAFSSGGETSEAWQAVASAKEEIQALGEQTLSMNLANSQEEVKTYLVIRFNLLTTQGPSYEVQVKELVPATAGSAEEPEGTNGSFTATVTITLEDATDTVDISGTITANKYTAPQEDITVTFQLLGDDHHEITSDADIHSYRFHAEELPIWIDTVAVTVPGGSTVGDVFKKVLDEQGYTYEGLDTGYISTITQPEGGISLTAMDDNRGDSGWMFLVNGKHAQVGLNSYILAAGDAITWHWTDQYKLEEGSEQWSSGSVTSYIENLIKAIGTVDSSDDCKARIQKARKAYDKLTQSEKETISNYQTLVEAEAWLEGTYTVSATRGSSASIGETVTASIQVQHPKETTYNSYALTVTYDTDMLTYTGIHADATVKDDNGVLTIIGYGSDKVCGSDNLVLSFTGKAVGEADVTITKANIDKAENVEAQDAPEAKILEASTKLTIRGYRVTLSDDFTGAATVDPGSNYTFLAKDPHYNYVINAKMGGEPAVVGNNGDGSYTIWGVTGDLVISALSKTPKTYKVTVEGTGLKDADAAASATYLTDYSFRLTRDEAYLYETAVTIEGKDYTPTLSQDGTTYTIAGKDITGDIRINISKEAKPVTTTEITFTGSGSGDVTGGTNQKADNGKDFTFTLDAEAGYDYNLTLESDKLAPNADGSYTIPGSRLTGQALTVEVEKTAKSTIEVDLHEYLKLEGKTMWLITATGTVSQDKVLSYDGSVMFWSEKYGAYCYLVISDQAMDEVKAEAAGKIGEAAADKVSITYHYDVNETGLVDVNDAQLTYNMYNASYADFQQVSMLRFLLADVNGDKKVDTLDATAIITSLLH